MWRFSEVVHSGFSELAVQVYGIVSKDLRKLAGILEIGHSRGSQKICGNRLFFGYRDS